MPNPIPLNCLRQVGVNLEGRSGTGFLVNRRGIVWLVTCVHLVTGRDESPIDVTPFIGATLRVVGTNVEIPFYLSGQKRFSLIGHEPTNTLLDVTALKLAAHEIQKLSHFGMYEIESIVSVEIAEMVTARGFPGLQTVSIPETVVEATVEQMVGISLVLSKSGAPGLSGGPVVSGKGLVGIAHGNLGTAPNFTNAQVLAFSSFAAHLFQ